MSITSQYRPSKRPSVKSVNYWDNIFEDTAQTWKGQTVWAKVERGEPFPDFYRVTYNLDMFALKKSKLFYGETSWSDTERFVYDLGLFNVSGRI
jgi:hypothetical protein